MRATASLFPLLALACIAVVSCTVPIEVCPSDGDGIIRTIRAGSWRGLRSVERLPGTGVAVAYTYYQIPPKRLLVNARGEQVAKQDTPADEAPPPVKRPPTDFKAPLPWAFDAQTNRIFVAGSKNRFVVVNRSTQVIVGEGQLPCKQVDFDACAQGGMVWVSTKEGEFLQIDMATCKVVGRTRLMDRHCDLHLTISPSGKRLAAVAVAFVSATNHPTVAEIYAIEGGRLRRIARTSTTLPGAVWEIALWDEEQALLFASPYPSHVWEYGP